MAVHPVKQTERFIKHSLKFLDNKSIRWAIIAFLIIYSTLGVPNFPHQVGAIFHQPLVQGLFLLAIIYVGVKDLGVALALSLAFIISLYMARRGDIFRAPRMVVQTEKGAVGQAVDIASDVLAAGEKVASTVLGKDLEDTARELTGKIMDGGDEPEGYNSTVNCFRACDDIIPLQGSQCSSVNVWGESGDVQGLQCPDQGFAALPPGAPLS